MKLFKLSMICSLLLAASASATVIPFTGDVPLDFASYTTVTVADPLHDVGIPLYAPPNIISGWEIEYVVFYLSLDSNILQIGLDAAGIAGDADGNGVDGNTAQWLLDNGGVDYWNLYSSESMGIAFDFDQDGIYDLIAGVSGFSDMYDVCVFSGFPALPFMAFGSSLPLYDGGHFYNPVAGSPDFEISLDNIMDWLVWNGDETCFNFLAFGGSFEDDGIGEEYVFGEVCLEDGTLTEVVMPNQLELAAYPNPFNPETQLRFTLDEASPVNLTVYNLAGQAVQTLYDSNLPGGTHEFTFNATNLPSGIYFAQLQTADYTDATRIMLLK